MPNLERILTHSLRLVQFGLKILLEVACLFSLCGNKDRGGALAITTIKRPINIQYFLHVCTKNSNDYSTCQYLFVCKIDCKYYQKNVETTMEVSSFFIKNKQNGSTATTSGSQIIVTL